MEDEQITVEGCSGSLSDPVALIVTGVEDQPDELAIYPNPSETQLFVRLPYPGTSDIRLINLMGRELQRLQSSESIAEINVASIPSGVYLIQVRVGTVVALSRFVKK